MTTLATVAHCGFMDASNPTPVVDGAATPETPAKAKQPRARKRRRRAPKPKRPDIFATFAADLAAIDWNDTIRREAAVSAVLGRLIVQVATVSKLTKEERERLQWVTQLARQLKDFRDTAAIDAALRLLNGDGMKEEKQADGPAMVPVVPREHKGEAGSGAGPNKAIRGRPRASGFS